MQVKYIHTLFQRKLVLSIQDHLYVQYVELNQFQNEFRELCSKFQENEKIISKLPMSATSLEEVNEE